MSREFLVSTLAAVALHAGALFGVRSGTAAVALPMGHEANIEVNLVAEVPVEAIEVQSEPPSPIEPEPMPPPEPVMEQLLDIEPEVEPEREVPPPPEPKPPRQTQRSSTPVTRPAITRQSPAGSIGARSTSVAVTMARPRYRSNPPPNYPSSARSQRQEGTAMLEVEVTGEGRARSVALQRSSGFPILDQAAITAVRRWTFEPGRMGGLPVSSRVQIPVRFRLSD